MAGFKGSIFFGSALAAIPRGIAALLPKKRRVKIMAAAAERMVPVAEIETPKGVLKYHCPTRTSARMPLSFFHLEPETTHWMDNHIQPGDVLWDVGANIGHFALYAAKVREAQVVGFEPSAQTFGLLNANIALNGLGESVSAYALALNDATGLEKFYLSSMEAGHAVHGLGEAVNLSGEFVPDFVQAVIMYRGDDLVKDFGVAAPDHIKVDVDGPELEVLQGLGDLIAGVKTVLVECEPESGEQKHRDLYDFLTGKGFAEDADIAAAQGYNRLFVKA